MVDLTALALVDPHAREFIVGAKAIAAAAGYKDARYFQDTVLTDVRSQCVLSDRLVSRFGPFGHHYDYCGQPVTHTNSAQVLGQNLQAARRAERQASTQRWRREGRCPVSAGSVVRR